MIVWGSLNVHRGAAGWLQGSVADKNDTVVRYALAGAAQPVAVSRYELTAETQKALPDEESIT
ncbi:hypothetical protein [Microbacterium sp. W4I20]|uniref:hypothetical protein n=1 Tax=Microbacterium sp. W4I20 TaxID=3042262 RepID=UPI0027803CA6|nr:hypothetical protein [Microbacterium sp. W4I20]MDQ0729190.1 hypothetical protein [Microbacterium sp. W4I20]